MPTREYILRKKIIKFRGRRMKDGSTLKTLLIKAHSLSGYALQAYGLSHGTAVRMRARIKKDPNLSIEKLKAMSPNEVLAIWYKPKNKTVIYDKEGNWQKKYLYPNIEEIYQKYIENHKFNPGGPSANKTKITFSLLINREYLNDENREIARKEGKSLLSLGHTLKLLKTYRKTKVSPTFRKCHEPGQTVEIDFTGAKAPYIDSNNELKYVDVLVAVLPYSRKLYARAIENQKSETVCMALNACFKEWKYVPKTITVDNFRGAVSTPSKYDGDLNKSFEQFARFYELDVVTARPYSPKDKGCCEAHVKIVTRSILASLRADMLDGKICHSIDELNNYISKHVEVINKHKVLGLNKTRNELFELEKQYMLKPITYEYSFGNIHTMKVQSDSRLTLYGHQYAVSSKWIGTKVDVELFPDYVNIYHQSYLITSYKREDNIPGLSSKEISNEDHTIYDGYLITPKSFIIEWANVIGPNAVDWVTQLLQRKTEYPQKIRYAAKVLSLCNAKLDLYNTLDDVIKQALQKSFSVRASIIIKMWKALNINTSQSTSVDKVYSSNNYYRLVKQKITGEIPAIDWQYVQNESSQINEVNEMPDVFLNGETYYNQGPSSYATRNN